MPGPSISITLDPDILLRIGDMRKAAAVADSEIQKIEKSALRAERAGQQLDQATVERLRKLEKVQTVAKQMMVEKAHVEALVVNAEKAKKDFIESEQRAASVANKLGKFQHRVFAARSLRALMSGEGGIDDAAQFAYSAEKSTLKLAKALGAAPEFMKSLSSAFAALPVVAEAVKIAYESYKQTKEGNEFEKDIVAKVRQHRMSGAEMKTFADAADFSSLWRVFGYDSATEGKKALDRISKTAEAFNNKELTPFFNKALDKWESDQVKGATRGGRAAAREQNAQIERAAMIIRKKIKISVEDAQHHGPVNAEDVAFLTRKAVAEFFQSNMAKDMKIDSTKFAEIFGTVSEKAMQEKERMAAAHEREDFGKIFETDREALIAGARKRFHRQFNNAPDIDDPGAPGAGAMVSPRNKKQSLSVAEQKAKKHAKKADIDPEEAEMEAEDNGRFGARAHFVSKSTADSQRKSPSTEGHNTY